MSEAKVRDDIARFALAMAERGWVAHLTLTHTKEHASAVVVLEAR